MPSEIEWKQLNQKGDKPSSRSGHTLSWIGGQNYMLFGGIEESMVHNVKENTYERKIGPNGDIYVMKLSQNDCLWVKEEGVTSDERPLARSQHVAMTLNDGNRVLIFGGHHTPKTRLNDTWIYEVPQKNWVRIGDEADNVENSASTIGAPSPRANMGSVFYEGKVYIQGGHGGIGFARGAFNDIFMFDPETLTWHELETVSEKVPDGRGGHSLFASDGKLFIYGGWNTIEHYASMW
jgi:hypothetical protein